jgi:TatD-related deoxyribonuclease
MKSPLVPITDDHIHIDPVNGRGLEAAKDFFRAGGTHMFLVSKPSWSLGVHPNSGADYAHVFDETVRISGLINEIGITAFPVLGVHPAEIGRLTERMTLRKATDLMMAGLDSAAHYVREGKAVALKSGRPHYPVDTEIMEASNEVLAHALALASDCSCALQIHAESGPCDDVVAMARTAGVPIERVVKHYATPDTPLHPSFIAKIEGIPDMVKEGRRFTLESDFMDENSRPGAVIGPKSVPRYTKKLMEDGLITADDCFRIHAETVQRVYGVEIVLR